MMKTLVYQSCRTGGVPKWLLTCMTSVRRRVDALGFEYRLVGDEILALVPDFGPDSFELELGGKHAFGHEVWIQCGAKGRARACSTPGMALNGT